MPRRIDNSRTAVAPLKAQSAPAPEAAPRSTGSQPAWAPRSDARPRPSALPAPDPVTGREVKSLFIDGRDPVQVLNALNASPGAAGLSEAQAAQLKKLITGTNEEFSVPVRRELAVMLGSEAYLGAPADKQAELLKTFVSQEVGVPEVVSVSDEGRITRKPYTLSEPVAEPAFAFAAHPADASRTLVTIGARQVTVHAASAMDPGLLQNSVDQVAKALAALPESSLSLVKEVRLEPAGNPDDAHFAKVYNRPGFQSYMTAGADGVVRIFPNAQPPTQRAIDGTIIHETGHILSHRMLGESADGPKWAPWREAEAKDGLHPSQYARTNPDEDLSETLELYTLVKGGPSEASVRALLPARFERLDSMLSQKVGP